MTGDFDNALFFFDERIEIGGFEWSGLVVPMAVGKVRRHPRKIGPVPFTLTFGHPDQLSDGVISDVETEFSAELP